MIMNWKMSLLLHLMKIMASKGMRLWTLKESMMFGVRADDLNHRFHNTTKAAIHANENDREVESPV
jgi:hypothetical protein